MSNIVIKKIQESMVSAPSSNYIKLFSNLDDNGILYYVKSNGDMLPVNESYSPVKQVTHAELWQMKNGSQLDVGTYYLITDYQTIYEQPDYYCDGTLKPSLSLKIGVTSSILVMAISSNNLSPDAYRVGDWVKDKIKYNIDWYSTEFGQSANAKGRITETIDEFGNRTDYDHRDIKFKRYLEYLPEESPCDGVIKDYDCVTGDVFGSGTQFTALQPGSVILLDVDGGYTLGLKIEQIIDDYNMKVYVDSNYFNGLPGPFQSFNSYQIDPTNYSFSGKSYTFYLANSNGVYNRYKEVYVGQSGFNDYDEFFTFNNNNLYCANNIIGDFSNNFNEGLSPIILSNNVFNSSECNNNNIGPDSVSNTVINNFVSNNISKFRYNVISGMIGNNIQSNFEHNYIKIIKYNNIVCENFSKNSLLEFKYNTVFDSFTYNKSNGEFMHNRISTDISNQNFLNSTHVHQYYNCDLFRSSENNLKLSYISDTNGLLIDDIVF